MRQAEMFGPNFRLERVIVITYGSDEISLTDTLKNEGYHPQPYMMLYHFNIGYPLLSDAIQLALPAIGVRGRDLHAQKHIESWGTITPPADSFREMCYYHQWPPDSLKKFGLYNPTKNLGIDFICQSIVLDHFVQWKMLEKGTYVLGLEPCTSTIEGRNDAKMNQSLKILSPGAEVVNHFNIRFTY